MNWKQQFESLLAECQKFGETLDYGYSRLTQTYQPKALGTRWF